jgi:Uma2 family endonuclease
MAAQKVPFVTPEDYLAREREAKTKNEYIAGEIIAMAGGSQEHTAIASDIHVALANALRGGSWEVYNSDLKVRLIAAGPFFYPDVTVVCGQPQVDFDDCLQNPTLIVEVVSESTASYDRGEKFVYYRRFPMLRHFLVIEQANVFVEHWERNENGLWMLTAEHTDRAEQLVLGTLGVVIPLAEIYRRISFPDAQ